MTTPQTKAKIILSPELLNNLPVGAKYQAKDGNATGTIEKQPNGKLKFTANCDSITLILTKMIKEVYRYKNENAELRTKFEEQKTVEVNRPNGWQWFQIYGFRIYIFLTIIVITYKKIKFKWLARN